MITLMHEDEMPANLSSDEYADWYDRSVIFDGVRIGPVIFDTSMRTTYASDQPDITHHCPNCEAAAREIADIAAVLRTGSSGDTLLGKEVSHWIDTAHAAEQERDDLRPRPATRSSSSRRVRQEVAMSDIEPICRKCGKSIPDGSWAGVKMARRGFEYEHLQCPSPCPNCEAAARELENLKSDKAWADKLSTENADELSNLRREWEALRAGILRVIDDYPRDIKQDAEEALRALLAETETK